MREQDEIDGAVEMVENRIERDEFPLLLAIWQYKRDALRKIGHGEIEEVEEVLNEAIQHDLEFGQYIQVQSGLNAAAWARDNIDTI